MRQHYGVFIITICYSWIKGETYWFMQVHIFALVRVKTIKEKKQTPLTLYCSSSHNFIDAPSQHASRLQWAVAGGRGKKKKKKDPAIMSHLLNMYRWGTACAAWSTPCQPPAVNALNITHSRSLYKVCERRRGEKNGEGTEQRDAETGGWANAWRRGGNRQTDRQTGEK